MSGDPTLIDKPPAAQAPDTPLTPRPSPTHPAARAEVESSNRSGSGGHDDFHIWSNRKEGAAKHGKIGIDVVSRWNSEERDAGAAFCDGFLERGRNLWFRFLFVAS